LAKLRAKRAIIAKNKGGIPQFYVMHNAGIESLAKYRPKTIEAAIGLPGITTRKSAALPDLLEIVRKYA
ncbi:MAG: HRDC domain-containing protein, partial [Puniceicoccales bacterium]|nr:HRDC domain-containing protein [Puniceicoccales bacterium]